MTPRTTLRAGDHGTDVGVLQSRLHRVGKIIDITHIYDPATVAAVRSFQSGHALVVDGIAGPRTLAALFGQPDTRALSQRDINAAADRLACEPAALQAVIEVESPNGGFLADGRVVILFERHVFKRLLDQAGIEVNPAHIPVSIYSDQRGGYLGGVAEYRRLAQAQAIDELAAFGACSWGRFQIMGYHAASLGYTDAVAMATAFTTGECEQLAAFERFVQADADLIKALRSRKWAAFARTYNGPAYADNLYDTKLARAYARHSDAQAAA